jgi:hypothetical protein
MANNENTALATEFKDRKAWMVVFGIFQILLGAICALLVPAMVLSMVASATLETGTEDYMTIGTLISSALFYLFLAVWFIWMGIGSINARRWARALILVASCIWLVGGLISFFFMVVYMPGMYDQMARGGEIPPELAVAMKYMTLGFVTVIYIIIPGVLALFYSAKNVKTTCELRDPNIRWTDKCPLPALGLSFTFGLGIASMVMVMFNGCVFPFFGHILSGIPGAAVILVVIGVLAYLCRGMYKLKMKAWRTAVGFVILGSVSAIISFLNTGPAEFYEKMDYTQSQIELMEQYDFLQGPDMVVYVGLIMLVFLAYLMYTRKFFVPEADGE